MMKHYSVIYDNETFIVYADNAIRAEEIALQKWLFKHGPKYKKTDVLYCPCQWGAPCEIDKWSTCGKCKSVHLG